MDAGRIVEFDTPTRLFDMEDGIFRGMCDRSKISLDDIGRAAKPREGRNVSPSLAGFGTLFDPLSIRIGG